MGKKKVKLHLNKAIAGMVLYSPVVSENGTVILAEGATITAENLRRLIQLGIDFIDIAIETTSGAQENFELLYQETLFRVKSFFSTISYFNEVPLKQMAELVDTMIDPMIDTPGAMHHLVNIPPDDYLFQHSLSVATVSGILGKWMGNKGDKLKQIILAGLLHDIGQTKVPEFILNKPDKLTSEEMEIIKKHPIDGYRILAKTPDVSQDVLLGVLLHHERTDGTGYPMGYSNDKIPEIAKIIAVADIYHAMTSDTVFRNKLTPFDVVYEINKEMYSKLDPNICLTFLNNLNDYLVGKQVILSDGRKATVITPGSLNSARSVIMVDDNEIIDLARHDDLSIIDYY